jgi:hypothetical protein
MMHQNRFAAENGDDDNDIDLDDDSDPDENDPELEQGEYTFENGAVYSGQLKGRFRHGHGVQCWPDGAKYEG